MENIYKERNIGIDLLKTIGILLIILAHTVTSKFILQIRNFDVPLMVILSAILSIDSYNKEKSYLLYIKKRAIRLLRPTYVFLAIFFIVTLFLAILAKKNYPFNLNKILDTIFLINGIGYVWIIRVYLIAAIITPLLLYMKKNLTTIWYIAILLVFYFLYEIIYFYVGDSNFFLQYIVYYIVSYGFIIAIGFELKDNVRKKVNIVMVVSFIIFITLMIGLICFHGDFIFTQDYKYPPRIYYISYAVLISAILIKYLYNINIKNINVKNIIIFISKNSMWIYLWHIMYIYILNWSRLTINEYIKYLIVLISSILTTYIQNIIINKFNIKYKTKINTFI